MDYKEVLANARKIEGLSCKACPECNGLACGNTMPGPGSKAPGNGANDNWKAWKNIKVNMDVIAPSTAVDMSLTLLGREFKLPIVTGPVGSIKWQYHPDSNVADYNKAIILACEKYGAAASFGDGIDPAVVPETMAFGAEHGGISMPIINPNADEEIMEKMDFCRTYAPYAMGVVIDSAGLPHLRAKNISAGTKTIEQLRKLKEHAGMPFLVKGVMSAKSALKALEAGADALIVSNHGGRVLPGTPATAEVLPEIADAVGGKMQIIVDGGIRNGLDIFKALALGADAVMICRPFITSYFGGGEEGICCLLEKLRSELSDTMYMCGARKLSDITRDMVRF